MKNNKAFTLIELLVVISILAILISILVPALKKAREVSQRASCANNLKALSVAIINYASDNEGELPHLVDLPMPDGGNPTFQEVTELTAIILSPDVGFYPDYISDLSLWHCPSDRIDFAGASAVERDPTAFSTLKNCSYMYISGYHLMRTAESPPLVPVLCDEANAREWGPASPGNMATIGKEDNHGDNIRNVLYLDGHVATIKGNGDNNAANAIFDNVKNPEILCSVD